MEEHNSWVASAVVAVSVVFAPAVASRAELVMFGDVVVGRDGVRLILVRADDHLAVDRHRPLPLVNRNRHVAHLHPGGRGDEEALVDPDLLLGERAASGVAEPRGLLVSGAVQVLDASLHVVLGLLPLALRQAQEDVGHLRLVDKLIPPESDPSLLVGPRAVQGRAGLRETLLLGALGRAMEFPVVDAQDGKVADGALRGLGDFVVELGFAVDGEEALRQAHAGLAVAVEHAFVKAELHGAADAVVSNRVYAKAVNLIVRRKVLVGIPALEAGVRAHAVISNRAAGNVHASGIRGAGNLRVEVVSVHDVVQQIVKPTIGVLGDSREERGVLPIVI
mmetsp:Transcript_28339/g.56615  ORF Transcript_28339/g.56615 Transcript_28339/m.56615 type:complete len:335 (+) Transcript_28339:398-1402(+)